MEKEIKEVSYEEWEDFITSNKLQIIRDGIGSYCMLNGKIVAKEIHGFANNMYFIDITNNQFVLSQFTNFINHVSNRGYK